MEVREDQIQRERGGEGLFRALFPELCVPPGEKGASLLTDALVFGISLLFAKTHLAYGAYPFALAYLAARRTRVVPAFLGAILGALSLGAVGGIFSLSYLVCLVLRVGLSYPAPRRVIFPVTEALFGEERGLRVLSAALSGAALAAYELLYSGIAHHTLYFASAAVLAPTVLCTLITPFYDAPLAPSDLFGRGEVRALPFGRVRPAAVEAAILVLLTSVAYALSPLALFGLDLSGIFSVGAALFVARRAGAARGAVTGLALGLIGSLEVGIALSCLGLASGLFFSYGALAATVVGLLAGIGVAARLGGLSGFLAIAPEAALGASLIFPLLSYAKTAENPAAWELDRRLLSEAARSAARATPPEGDRLHRLGAAFSSLSSMFYRRQDEARRPRSAEYLAECEGVCARHCATCSNRVRCWEQGDRPAERAVYALSAQLYEVGRITEGDLSDELCEICPRHELILDEIRDACAAMALTRFRGEWSELLSQDYAMLSRLLSDASDFDRAEECEDTEGENAILSALGNESEGLALAVYGTRKKRLAAVAHDPRILKERTERLRSAAEEAFGCRLTPPTVSAAGQIAVTTMETARRYTCEACEAGVPIGGTSGDVIRFFESEDGYFCALLSDGMGSGERAAEAAGLCTEFLETMLRAGAGRKSALRMCGELVRTQGEECSTTVDLMILDLCYGGATFIKSGAAPSYIKRGGEILRVRARTMPLGILHAPDAEQINVDIKAGDILVLLSDGLAPDNEDPDWLLSLLSRESGDVLSALATRIVAEAVSRPTPPTDDITVGLVRITELLEEEK